MIHPRLNKRTAYLVDTTLRDGQQAPGVSFTSDQCLTIARRLDEAGIGEIEVGTPAMGEDECNTIRRIAGLGLSARLTAWCRAEQSDLDLAASCGVTAVHISLPVSDILLSAMGRTRSWVIARLESLLPYAIRRFTYVSVGAQDASRATARFLAEYARTTYRLGADRLRLADTVGIWNPAVTTSTFMRLRKLCRDRELGFHGHNDLGMATANSIAALQGSASCIDVTVTGLGERAGNAALEQVALASRVCLRRELGVRMEQLCDLAKIVSKASRRPIPTGQPVVGPAAFAHESGIHVRCLLRDSRAYEPVCPESVGVRRSFVIGKHSGRSSLVHALTLLGRTCPSSDLPFLLQIVRREANMTGSVTPTRLMELSESLV
ncbi:MAG: hypothetical protein GXY44_03230 [Phycisphaerales bacterium]|nr:hypothetical protein [Phycisphaerales bacterium]